MNSIPHHAIAAVPAFEPRLCVVDVGPRIVKRYGNRKLYDTATSRYVKLEEVADLVRSGVEVQVLDHGSGRDITSVALAHIIFDEEVRASHRRAGVLVEVIRGRDALSPGHPDPRAAERRADERARRAVSEAHRATVCVGQRLAAADGALERVREVAGARRDVAHQVLDAVARARRDLSRVERRIEALHERLRALEA